MAPPAKRRKCNVVVSSSSSSDIDEENEDEIISTTPPAVPSRSFRRFADKPSKPVPSRPKPLKSKELNQPPAAANKGLQKQKTAKKAIGTSPEKPNLRSKKPTAGKNADIQALFSKQAESQREVGSRLSRRTLSRTSSLAEDNNDPISDDEIAAPRSQLSSVAATAKKRKQGLLPSVGENEIPASTQRFKPTFREKKVEEDTRPWADRFGPVNLEELAVHKRKVADVRAWLEAVSQGGLRQRLLILKGAAGVGKTTTVQLLAKDMKCEVLEWRNADGSIASSDGFLSMSAQFEEFMGRGGKFGQLDVFSTGSQPPLEEKPKSDDRRKQMILIEEFPSTFSSSSNALQSFRATILQYLAANTPSLSLGNGRESSQPVTPVVMVISETLLTTSSASADSFTAHRLLGPEILQHPSIHVIEFKAIAPTFLAKALDLVIQKESRKSGRRKTPGPLVLKRLGEVGDIRSAVGSLEFLCLRGDSTDWSGRVSFAKTKRGSKNDPEMTQMEKESLELVTRREASLGIFHAVGKVMHNKRDDKDENSATAAVERLPEYLSLHSRPRKSEVMVDELIDETGTDTQTFIAALHENYLLSCDAPPTSIDFSSMDHVNDCIDALSDSDLLSPSWDGSFNSTGFGGGTGGKGSGGDILRQDEISFQTAVRGILFALPCPVKRRAPTSKGGNAFSMFYPTSLKLWRTKEEIEGTIDTWVLRLKRGEIPNSLSTITTGAKAFAKPKPGSVESWSNNNTSKYNHTSSSKSNSQKGKGIEDEKMPPLLATGTSARKEMLLERLPYMVQIARSRRSGISIHASSLIKEMEKVTTFSGIGAPEEEIPDDGDEGPVAEEWATDKVGSEEVAGAKVKSKKWGGRSNLGNGSAGFGNGGFTGMATMEQEVQKLVLSDDDIEDD